MSFSPQTYDRTEINDVDLTFPDDFDPLQADIEYPLPDPDDNETREFLKKLCSQSTSPSFPAQEEETSPPPKPVVAEDAFWETTLDVDTTDQTTWNSWTVEDPPTYDRSWTPLPLVPPTRERFQTDATVTINMEQNETYHCEPSRQSTSIPMVRPYQRKMNAAWQARSTFVPIALPTTGIKSVASTVKKNRHNDESVSPSDYIDGEPTTVDVRFGRGDCNTKHPGNKFFLELILHHQAAYKGRTSDGKTKQAAVLAIVKAIRQRGGRFVKKEAGPNGRWYVIPFDHKQVYEKITQSLRDNHSRSYRTAKRMKFQQRKKELKQKEEAAFASVYSVQSRKV